MVTSYGTLKGIDKKNPCYLQGFFKVREVVSLSGSAEGFRHNVGT